MTNHENEHETMTLTLDDNTEVECNILGIFDVEEKDYIALLPLDDDEFLIYQYKEDGEEIVLENIESDEEFEKVSEAFYSFFEEALEDYEYDEYDEDEDEEDEENEDTDEE